PPRNFHRTRRARGSTRNLSRVEYNQYTAQTVMRTGKTSIRPPRARVRMLCQALFGRDEGGGMRDESEGPWFWFIPHPSFLHPFAGESNRASAAGTLAKLPERRCALRSAAQTALIPVRMAYWTSSAVLCAPSASISRAL